MDGMSTSIVGPGPIFGLRKSSPCSFKFEGGPGAERRRETPRLLVMVVHRPPRSRERNNLSGSPEGRPPPAGPGLQVQWHLKIAFKLLGIVCLPPEVACGTQRGLVSLGATGYHQTRTRAPAGASGERV